MESLHATSPLVSIITPIYNAADFLEKTILSVRAQSYQNWELLLVLDKNSTDGSAQIAKHWAAQDPRIKYISAPNIPGVAANRNRGLEVAQGEYVAFLDADDLWYPEKLGGQIHFMQSQKTHFSFCGYEWIDEKGEPLYFSLPAPTRLNYSDLLRHTYPIGCLTVMIYRPAFSPIEFPQEGSEDFIVWLKLLKQTSYAHGLPQILAQYRILGTSRSRRKGRAATFRWKTLRQIENLSLPKSIFYFTAYTANSLLRVAKSRCAKILKG